MRIDKKLNLVIPVTDEGKPVAFVHSMPISTEVFDTYFLPLSRTYAAIFALGLGPIAGPRVADKLLKKTAIELNMWDTVNGVPGVQAGLVGEIHRLTNVIHAGKQGWETMPYGQAKQAGILTPADAAEVDAAIVFFTVTYSCHPRAEFQSYMGAASSLWTAQLVSSNVTEYQSSLPTPSAIANTPIT